MKRTMARVHARLSKEAKEDAEECAEIASELAKWRRRTVWLGVSLLFAVGAVIPFLARFPLHNAWDSIGKKLLLVAMCLWIAFTWTAATTYNFWRYLREYKKICGLDRNF